MAACRRMDATTTKSRIAERSRRDSAPESESESEPVAEPEDRSQNLLPRLVCFLDTLLGLDDVVGLHPDASAAHSTTRKRRGLMEALLRRHCNMPFVAFLCVLLAFAIATRVTPGLLTGIPFLIRVDPRGYTDEQVKVLKVEPLSRLKQLASISDSPKYLQRTFLSKGAIEAGKIIQKWMEDAGMTSWVDDIGNVHGRVNSGNTSAPALLIGSHLDTVIDAGMYDGSLGIIAAIAAVKALNIEGKLDSFPRPVEVIAFSDEEGVRFQSTFLGSAAVAGMLDPGRLLGIVDKNGITLENALKDADFPGTVRSLKDIGYDRDDVWGYIEVHIEQGPVLEQQGAALGVVGSIAGQTRLAVKLRGTQGHAGTVPMGMRRDPMSAAAEAIVGIEQICKHSAQDTELPAGGRGGALLCTVGEISAWPGASNVIPAEVSFTVDIRAENDDLRAEATDTIRKRIEEASENRRVAFDIAVKHEADAVQCHPDMMERLRIVAEQALRKVLPPASSSKRNHHHHHHHRWSLPVLVSGAGHDAVMIAHLTKVGMLFVRCAGGISHSPDEHVLENDIWAATLALKLFLDNENVIG